MCTYEVEQSCVNPLIKPRLLAEKRDWSGEVFQIRFYQVCSVLLGGGFGSIIVVYDSCGIPRTNYMCYLINLSPEVAVNNPSLNTIFDKIGWGRKSSSF
jgi:hypothetical protein